MTELVDALAGLWVGYLAGVALFVLVFCLVWWASER